MIYRYHQFDQYDGRETAEAVFESIVAAFPQARKRFVKQNERYWREFVERIQTYLPPLAIKYFEIYHDCAEAYPIFRTLVSSLIDSWMERPETLKKRDHAREKSADWFRSNEMVGGVCYVDLYAGTLKQLIKRIPYFKELGLTYLHLMPIFRCPAGENDGGYAISSYREVDPRLGSTRDVAKLAEALADAGIILVMDFVFNHTSDEHEWALKARAGDQRYANYYWIFEDRTIPDQFEATLREIFPDEHPGAFTYFPEMGRWVWTTFHSYQWDLNYQNPEVFVRMMEEMLSIANLGVDVLRLDAVAFIWKEMGTTCETRPTAMKLIEAFNLTARISAPSLLFKSEAIVHPDQVVQFISPERCQLSYNPLLMALSWEALATRDTKLLALSMATRFALPEHTAWVNYTRCHDDIGWTFSDEDAWSVGIDPQGHRAFLNQFYTGRFPGSFASGLPFQENPKTGDCRISGMMASLCGVEKAIGAQDERELSLAIGRMTVLFGVALTIGGIPLLYLGDELGLTNDYGYRDDPAHAEDSRWVHRHAFDKEVFADRRSSKTATGRIYRAVRRLIEIRKSEAIFRERSMTVLNGTSRYLFAYAKESDESVVVCVANFSEHLIPLRLADTHGFDGCAERVRELVEERTLFVGDLLSIDPYAFKIYLGTKCAAGE